MMTDDFLHAGKPLRPGDNSPGEDARAESKIIDEEVFIRKTIESDAKAGCEVLFQKYYTLLCSHAVRFVYSREIAEDIVSDIFCRFWEDGIYATITTSYRAYLFKAVRYSAYNYIRWELSRKNKTVDTDNLQSAVSSMKPEQALLYDELAAEIEHVIAALPAQCKRVFLLSRFEHKKYAEIAAEMNISVKAVEAHISKALDTLRKSLRARDMLTLMLLAVLTGGI